MSRYSYNTISSTGDSIFKDRGSKFIGYAFNVESKEDIKAHLQSLREKYHDARHHCYGYRLFTDPIEERANDDGEPGNSAGTPILNQIYSYDLHNALVVVIRYFGGTKLGVPGLINAYKSAAREALSASVIHKIELTKEIIVQTGYDHINDVMRLIKKYDLKIIEQQSTDKARIVISIKESTFDEIMDHFNKNIYLATTVLNENP